MFGFGNNDRKKHIPIITVQGEICEDDEEDEDEAFRVMCSDCGKTDETFQVESSYCGSYCYTCFKDHCKDCEVCREDKTHPFNFHLRYSRS
jgi:hypothetical protein